MKDIEFYSSGDDFFDKLWEMIDESKISCWILTYHMAKSFIADETIRRLIKAAERGVDVVLYVDWLNYTPDLELVEQLRRRGGKVEALNSMNVFVRPNMKLKIFTKSIFKRYHEKLCIIDDCIVVGSANFDNEYGSVKYGNNRFHDLNIIVRKRCLRQAQGLFLRIAEKYGYTLTPHIFPEISDEDIEILSSDPYYFRYEIQEYLLEKINSAENRIIMAQGYYFNIKKVQSALKRAKERGVKIELLTTQERDQLVYKDLTNLKIAKRLLRIGADVNEMSSKILHSKVYIIDDDLILGSFNNDKWSWSMNSEMCLSFTNKQVTESAMIEINEIKRNSHSIKEKFRDLATTMISGFWQLFLKNSEFMMNTKKNYKYFLLNSYVDDEKNSIEERYLMRLHRIEKYKISTSTLALMVCS